MGQARKFEDLKVWQDARQLCAWVSAISPKISEKRLYRLKDQLEGSSGSIMDNIAEGYERTGKKELINILIIAKGSAGEFRSQLYRLADNAIISQEELESRLEQSLGISKQITGFIKYLKNTEIDGWRFSEPAHFYSDSQEQNESHG